MPGNVASPRPRGIPHTSQADRGFIATGEDKKKPLPNMMPTAVYSDTHTSVGADDFALSQERPETCAVLSFRPLFEEGLRAFGVGLHGLFTRFPVGRTNLAVLLEESEGVDHSDRFVHAASQR